MFKEGIGEFFGTFLLVFIGCGSVALAVLFGTFTALWQVAAVWGVGVALAIYVVGKTCPAHLNPAVTFAFWVSGATPLKRVPVYIIGQFLGAMMAAVTLYFIFYNPLINYEASLGLLRGSPESHQSAMMFGEFFPNPAYENTLEMSHLKAIVLEGLGTFVLVFTIFWLVDRQKKFGYWIPLLIGLTVSLIICMIAPYTQAGLNPARDFGPRLIAYFAGWGNAAFPKPYYGFFTVYILAPIVGGVLAVFVYRYSTRLKNRG